MHMTAMMAWRSALTCADGVCTYLVFADCRRARRGVLKVRFSRVALIRILRITVAKLLLSSVCTECQGVQSCMGSIECPADGRVRNALTVRQVCSSSCRVQARERRLRRAVHTVLTVPAYAAAPGCVERS